ncbi:hypothetical protein [Elizabethkingia anophelis]|uniref:hypothetical protein n=1 Tax=Elizabethkingia anophelis TaxID=1117645 RepID=UPI000995CE5F|nr:hypothetical protein [Elizabethkingia anophelis]AQW92937.1 hypothetical protein BBD30_01385 [Elizabethkingia anophelis]MDV3917691.1 hypothetical protein [Elizabethkingia anophelis]MDV4095664.1 hypothetical protein [Elizabethkingia anophelis]OPB61451.1 hypothetical protein BAS07_16875 [Elizabethkingia anophelis]HAY3591755.1 hypothetical protein [Elizabethkingia anophelis]
MKNCIIIFSKHYGFCYQEALAELIVDDENTLNEILDLGFKRNDLQSLFVKENIEYLTSYSVYFTVQEPKAPEYKNKEQAINLVKKICSERGFNISEEFNCFDFSFPKTMFI